MNNCTFYSGCCLLICIVSKKLNVMFMFIYPLLIIVYVQLFWSTVLCQSVKDVSSILK